MQGEIETLLQEKRVFEPSIDFTKNAHLNAEQYQQLYQESIESPETFWAKQAESELEWIKKWDSVLDYNFDSIGELEEPYLKFFTGGQINVCHNCVDRHLATRANKAAIIWQGEKEEESRTLTYKELHREVCKFANALKASGVKKGTTITLYMPMIPELAIAVLACARIGAIHSVVFSAFSPDSLASRIQDGQCQVVITSDVSYHAGKVGELKKNVDLAIANCPTVKNVIVFNRGNTSPEMTQGRDLWWHEITANVADDCPAEPMGSEDPLFMLYTSGSTGKPKGVLHTSAGYLLYTHLTFKYVFDYKEEDVFWCTADIGWITGHSYFVYGPLSNGATNVMFEGVPTYPEPNRFWQIVERHKVSIFYTAPTAIRALMRLGSKWPEAHDLSSLKTTWHCGRAN